ncbi:MAG: hypothetical protein NVS9B10_03540 [Nevskia sp.]
MSASAQDKDASIFLAALDVPGAVFSFQTFDDTPAKRPGFAQVNHGALADHTRYLARMNERGAGVFVTVNETDGMGRKAKNVQRVRALFVDLDGAPLAPVLASPLPAHIIVESSPDRWHAYWLIRDCPLDQFKPAQKKLAAHFHGDDKVIDLPRVMRLPGFIHRKGEPFRTRIHQLVERAAYDFAELRAAFDIEPPASSPRSAATPCREAGSDRQDLIDDLREALRSINADDYKLWVDIGLALKTLDSDGSILWLEWSQSSAKFDMSAAAREWQRFKPTSIGHAFVFARAKECGWRPADAPSVKRKRAARAEPVSDGYPLPPGEAAPMPDDESAGAPAPRAAPRAKPAEASCGLRARFTCDDRGVWHHGVDAKDGSPLPPYWVCPALDVAAYLRDLDGTNWGRLLVFRDKDDTEHRWGMPMRQLSGGCDEMRAELLRLGFDVPVQMKNRNLLTDYIQQSKPEARARCVERASWHGRVFVMPERTIGEADEMVLFQSETTGGHVYRERGTLDQWRSDLADLCRGNSRLLFAVSAAFAGPLLHWAGDESGGFNLRGISSTGKTTALRAAAAVWGGPEFMRRWRATDNGLESIAAQYSDGLLILDELGQMDPRIAGDAAYMLANGEGKARAGRGGSARPVITWRLLFLSAGELSLAEHMRQGGKQAQAGQETRMADIPADAGAGLGVFDTLHGYASGSALSRAILDAAADGYGVAGPAFLRALLPQLDTLPETIRTLRRAFLARHVPKGVDGQVVRVAGRIALIAAAGELATLAGITGWEAGEADAACARCLDAWIDTRGGTGNLEPLRRCGAGWNPKAAHGFSTGAKTRPRKIG